jgi:DNA-binding MarR family transcriptional regulator
MDTLSNGGKFSIRGDTISRLRRVLETLQAVDDFTISAVRSFLTVAMFEGRSLREYMDLTDLPQSTMSRHLLDLGPMNRKREPGLMLISQRQDPADLRKNVYLLTPKGHSLVAEITQALGD